MNKSTRNFLAYLVILTVSLGGLYSCKSSETTSEDRSSTLADTASASSESELNLAAYRNTLGDSYATQQHDIPAFLSQSADENQSGNRSPFEGYRIQLISTRNVALADSVARAFRVWSDTTIVGYVPEAHVSFNQPYFKVHVGDFHSHERANAFSRIVKRQYPEAWVVHDRISPNSVPSDTVRIRLRSEVEDTVHTN